MPVCQKIEVICRQSTIAEGASPPVVIYSHSQADNKSQCKKLSDTDEVAAKQVVFNLFRGTVSKCDVVDVKCKEGLCPKVGAFLK